jgi:hypothetical protein
MLISARPRIVSGRRSGLKNATWPFSKHIFTPVVFGWSWYVHISSIYDRVWPEQVCMFTSAQSSIVFGQRSSWS